MERDCGEREERLKVTSLLKQEWRVCFDGRTMRAFFFSLTRQVTSWKGSSRRHLFLLSFFFPSNPKRTDTSCRHDRKRKPEEDLGSSTALALSILGFDPTEAFSPFVLPAHRSSFSSLLFFSLSASSLCSSAPPLTCLRSPLRLLSSQKTKRVPRPLSSSPRPLPPFLQGLSSSSLLFPPYSFVPPPFLPPGSRKEEAPWRD